MKRLIVNRDDFGAGRGINRGIAEAHRHGILTSASLMVDMPLRRLTGRLPTHVDSHHNVHRDPRLLPCFQELAEEHRLPLRGHSPARYFPAFSGQWDGGERHLEWIAPASLARMLAADLGPGTTELSCHPGYVDSDFASSYSVERETELRTLCDPAIRRAIGEQGIALINFGAVTV